MKYLVNKNIEIVQEGSKVTYQKPFIPNEKLILGKSTLSIYEKCKKPVSIKKLKEDARFDIESFKKMVNHSIICQEDELSFLSNGFLTPPKDEVWKFFNWDEFIQCEKTKNSFLFFGVPIDNAGMKGGARFGSMLIREALKRPIRKFRQAKENKTHVYDFEMRRKINSQSLQIFDVGDIFCPPFESQKEIGLKIAKVVRTCIKESCVPIMLGGDHSITFHSVNAIADIENEFGIIHFDAHHDIYVNSTPQQKSLNHGNAFAHLLKRKELKHLHQIGLRTFDYLSNHSEKVRDDRVSYFSAYEVQNLPPKKVFKKLKDIPYYISFDIDCLSPNVTSDTGTPVIGGLSFYQALNYIDYASRNFKIIGYDFVEVSDNSLNNMNFGGEIIAKYISVCISNCLSNSKIE